MEARVLRLECHLPDQLDDEDWETIAYIVEWVTPGRYAKLPADPPARKAAMLRVLDDLLEELGRAEPQRRCAAPS